MVMTCIEHDILEETTNDIIEARIPGITHDMVYYADDTIIFSTQKDAIDILLEKTKEYQECMGWHSGKQNVST